jgi:hypothetical protein
VGFVDFRDKVVEQPLEVLLLLGPGVLDCVLVLPGLLVELLLELLLLIDLGSDDCVQLVLGFALQLIVGCLEFEDGVGAFAQVSVPRLPTPELLQQALNIIDIHNGQYLPQGVLSKLDVIVHRDKLRDDFVLSFVDEVVFEFIGSFVVGLF